MTVLRHAHLETLRPENVTGSEAGIWLPVVQPEE